MSIYRELTLWKNLDDESAARFRCLQELVTGKYCVQNVDFFYLPVDHDQLQNSEKRFAELLIDVAPIERCEWFETIENAVAAHESDFSG